MAGSGKFKKGTPSAERVRELFDYDPLTGLLTNKVRRAKAAPGSECGGRHAMGYRSVSVDCMGPFLVHRVIWLWMTGEWPVEQIDHIDLDRANNRWANLRAATPGQNNANRTVSVVSKSGIKGAHFHPQTGKWRARIQHHGKSLHIGMYETPEQAGTAYLRVAESIHGEYARGSL